MALSINLDIAKRLDITCRKGDSFSLEIIVKDANGDPVDLKTPDKYIFAMQVRESDSSDSVVIDTGVEGFIITGSSSGAMSILASSSVMSSVPSGIFVYDLQATEVSTGLVHTWFLGIFKINEDVTV